MKKWMGAALALCLLLTACGGETVQTAVDERQPRQVTGDVAVDDLREHVVLPGTEQGGINLVEPAGEIVGGRGEATDGGGDGGDGTHDAQDRACRIRCRGRLWPGTVARPPR